MHVDDCQYHAATCPRKSRSVRALSAAQTIIMFYYKSNLKLQSKSAAAHPHTHAFTLSPTTSFPPLFRYLETMSAAADSGAGAGAGAGAAAAVALDEATTKLFAHVDANVDTYVERLAECVAFRGVSADPAQRGEVVRTVEWAADWIRRLGGTVELRDLGKQTLSDESTIPLPPAIFAQVGTDASKPTLFVYGHLDVQPAEPEGWNTDPWVLTNVDGALYGRGSTGAWGRESETRGAARASHHPSHHPSFVCRIGWVLATLHPGHRCNVFRLVLWPVA